MGRKRGRREIRGRYSVHFAESVLSPPDRLLRTGFGDATYGKRLEKPSYFIFIILYYCLVSKGILNELFYFLIPVYYDAGKNPVIAVS